MSSPVEDTNARMLTQVTGKLLESLSGSNANIVTAIEAATAAVNTLPIYTVGTWTPVLTFETPGDLAVVYSIQLGYYTKIGRLVAAQFTIVTSTFTHTTASGDCQITGLPFANGAATSLRGVLHWQGITKATYTDITVRVPAAGSLLVVEASGSGVAESDVSAANMPTGGTVILAGSITYFTG